MAHAPLPSIPETGSGAGGKEGREVKHFEAPSSWVLSAGSSVGPSDPSPASLHFFSFSAMLLLSVDLLQFPLPPGPWFPNQAAHLSHIAHIWTLDTTHTSFAPADWEASVSLAYTLLLDLPGGR